MAHSHPHCGQAGRVCRVFWRGGVPWVLMRCSSGMMVAVPWHATDLPIPALEADAPARAQAPPLLSPAAPGAAAPGTASGTSPARGRPPPASGDWPAPLYDALVALWAELAWRRAR